MKLHGYNNYNYSGTNEDHWHGMRQILAYVAKIHAIITLTKIITFYT